MPGTSVLSRRLGFCYTAYPSAGGFFHTVVQFPHVAVQLGLTAILLALALPLWRQRRSVRAGLCPKCGYDLRAHHPGDKCPECGTVVPGGAREGKGA